MNSLIKPFIGYLIKQSIYQTIHRFASIRSAHKDTRISDGLGDGQNNRRDGSVAEEGSGENRWRRTRRCRQVPTAARQNTALVLHKILRCCGDCHFGTYWLPFGEQRSCGHRCPCLCSGSHPEVWQFKTIDHREAPRG